MVELHVFKKKYLNKKLFNIIENIGNELFNYLNTEEILLKLKSANKPNNNSINVQNVFLEKAEQLGFISEKKGLFKDIPTSNLRPDFFKKIDGTGILIEVERGKTIMNNMDLLDFWKCHLCHHANHLFLFVPLELKHNSSSKPYNCFKIVKNRMSPFFEKPNYTNVDSLWIYGY